jgi:hypothetical protein
MFAPSPSVRLLPVDPMLKPRQTLASSAITTDTAKHESRLPWLVATLAAVALPAGLRAADITVTTTTDVVNGGDGLISLREAISTFNGSGGNTTIILPAGTFTIALAGSGDDSNATGDFDAAGEGGSSLTIRGAGGGATIINGAGLDRVFHLRDAADFTLERLKIRNGSISGQDGADGSGEGGTSAQGGGVLSETSGSLTLRDVIIEDCEALGGNGGTGINQIYTATSIGGNGGSGGTARGGALAIIGTASGKAVTLERVGFYRNLAQGGDGNTGGQCDNGEANTAGGQGGTGGEANGGAVYTNNSTNVDLQFKQVLCEENTAQGGNGGAGGNASTSNALYTSSGGACGYPGSAFGGAFYVSSNNSVGSPHVFTDLVATDNEAKGGLGGNGGIGHANAPTGAINGRNGSSGGDAIGGGIFASGAGYLRFVSGDLTNNRATGGLGGNGGSSGSPGAALMNGGNAGDGGTGDAGGIYTFGEGHSAMHIQFDPSLSCTGNSAIGGNGGAGGAGANAGTDGEGGDGGYSNAPGIHVASFTSVGMTGEGPEASGNIHTVGTGGLDGDGIGSGGSGESGGSNFSINSSPVFNDVSGRAWADSGTANDVRDVGEPSLAGVDVAFTTGANQVLNTETGSDGTYAFSTTWTTASNLTFTANHFTGTLVAQDSGADDTVDSDVNAGGVVSIAVSSTLTNVDAGYDDPGPITGTFNLTITGLVSADVSAVSIGDTIVTPTNGRYTITVAVPASAGSVVLVTTNKSGSQSSRTILFDNAALPPG